MQLILEQNNIEIPKSDKELSKCFFESELLKTDIYFYSGEIFSDLDTYFKELLCVPSERKCMLILTTPGGDADAAFKVARMLQTRYGEFSLMVPAECKSAGTLVALGAKEIIFDEYGELGPLDVQIFDPDEFLTRTSGLAISQALDYLCDKAFSKWEEFFIQVRFKSRANITTQTAAEIATQLAVGLFSPISGKIELSRLGELERSVSVAEEYGFRLGAKRDCVQRLIRDYPSHSFVIDFREAKSLFSCVRQPKVDELTLLSILQQFFTDQYKHDFVHEYASDMVLQRFELSLEGTDNDSKDNSSKKEDSANQGKRDSAAARANRGRAAKPETTDGPSRSKGSTTRKKGRRQG
ncbi:SDH family Clp fold serine proteinase [Pirellulaceae bacterium SH501]